jgi:hypothetical protein
MKNSLYALILFFFIPNMLFTQNNISKWLSPQSAQKHHFTFQYFRIDRKQISGGTEVKLNTNFDYLNIFDNSQRFAPDEPSSFSSLEYTFLKKQFPNKTGYQFAAGIYRNHIKGDFLLKDYVVHFGRGNSQVGLAASTNVWVQVLNKFELAFSFQFGAGPQFTKLTANENKVAPEKWGGRGWGATSNIGLWANSPIFFKRFAFGVGAIYNYTYSKYGSFEIENANSGEVVKYEKVHFTAVSNKPKPTVLFKYYFYKMNNPQ